jgi:hypothetical protein
MFPIQNVPDIQEFSMILVKFFLPPTFPISCGEEDVIIFMYLRAIFCTFQISVDFYFVPVGGRGGGRGGIGEGEGARERGRECILYGYT